jgi:hypothetical protein
MRSPDFGRRIAGVAALAAAASLGFSVRAEAQTDSVKVTAAVSAVVGTPVAAFGERVGGAVGAEGMLRVGRDSARSAWRVGLGVLVYGWDTETVCVTTSIGCRLRMGVTTTNAIWSLETGPEWRVSMGQTQLRGAVLAGASLMLTTTGVSGDYTVFPILSQREIEDLGFVWGAGVGATRALGPAVSLDVEAGYRQHGLRRYLVEGGIEELTSGAVSRDVQRSDVSLLQWRVGLRFALPQDKDR